MSATILIAEDHPASLELMRYLLAAHGYRPLAAVDGEAALDLARRERPDLIICDLQMPKVDGYGIVTQVRADARLREVRVIAVTAFSMHGDRERVLRAGFDGYFSKPIEPETFVQQMESFLPPALRAHRVPGA
jgi:two-component system cell cycle response regulator DivK